MDKSIEAAARAIYENDWKDAIPCPWDHCSVDEQLYWRDSARAAIAAYRDAEIERLNENIKTLLANHQAVRAKLEAAERDAARYRWLRDAGGDGYWNCYEKDGYGGHQLKSAADLDAAIDAARGGERV